jgi:DNA polymerase-3 subunit delta'
VSFRHIRGHEHLVQQFAQAAARHRLAHAYLFVGPEGVGKRTFALALAKTLLCENRAPASATGAEPEAFAACQNCPACRWFDAGTHPDFRYLGLPAEKHEFPLELIHEVIRILSVKPARSQYRLVVLDDADTLNEESANAFLKTLEEPPPRSILILLGTSPDYQLPTIRSRCQIVYFHPLPEQVVADYLREQGLVKSQPEALRIARLSQGSLTQARLLANPEVWSFRQKLWESLSGGNSDAVHVAELMLTFVESAGKDSASQRQRAHLAVGFLVELYRLALRLHADKQIGQQLSEQDKKYAAAVVDRLSVPELLRRLDRCMMADYQIDRRLHLALVLEALADSLVS